MPPQRTGRRAQARAQMEAAILAAGHQQLIERGAAAVSLREIARSIGVVSSAVYRYVESRDALLTLLVIDAYDQLADSVDQALESCSSRNGAEQLHALAHAMRQWARQRPEQWGLIYGAPVPGYEAPRDATSGPGTRVMARLLAITAASDVQTPSLPRELTGFLESGNAALQQAASSGQALLAVRAWCTIVGTINMEVFGQLGPETRTTPRIGQVILDQQLLGLSAELGDAPS